MKKAVVLGIGNRLMEDDGIGNRVVEELKKRKALPDCRLTAGETDTDYCLDEIEGADTLIIIDASVTGAAPCSVAEYPFEDILKHTSPSCFSHHYSLIHALKQRSYGGIGILITIEACSITYHHGLSPGMEAQLPRIVDEVCRIIKTYTKNPRLKR